MWCVWNCCLPKGAKLEGDALQAHQQRKALHKEHEELFDAEVEKLVELNHINQLAAVARQRCASAALLSVWSVSASYTSCA